VLIGVDTPLAIDTGLSTTFVAGGSDKTLSVGTLSPVSTLADRVRWILENRDFRSQRDLSLKAGLSESHVGLLARGDLGKKTASETLEKIARAANVSFHWLSTGEGSPDQVALVPDSEEPFYGNAPGWTEAEKKAIDENRDVPRWAFEKSRRHRGLTPPNPVTVEFVLEQALLAWKWTPDAEKIERERKKIEAQAQALRTRHENKLRKQKLALEKAENDAAPPKAPEPKKKRGGGK
jgi:transcriptional regulator with XRE-family HTH domain